jgi:hypothetical protein
MATLNEILGGDLTIGGLLGSQAQAQAEQRAQNAALVNFGLNALVRSQGQAGQPAPGLAQVLAASAIPAVSAYQQSFDKTLTDAIKNLQVQDLLTKRKESQQLRTLLPQVFKTTRAPSQTIYDVEGETTIPGAVTGVSIDPARLQALMMVPGGMEAVKGLAETQKLLRQSGLTMGAQEAPSPFAPYLAAQSPEVRKLAENYDKGFRSGTIDEETAYKRVEPLARMEESYISRVESMTDRRIAREEAREERRIAREQAAKPTEGEKKTATLAGRLEQSLTDLKKIEEENPKALSPEVTPSLLQSGLLSYIPGAEMIAGKISSSDRLRAEAAQLDALDAALTLGTGAAYTREQLRGYAKAYFPQIGDTPDVITEKNTRFANIVRLARSQAGAAYVPPAQDSSLTVNDVRKNYGLEGKKR